MARDHKDPEDLLPIPVNEQEVSFGFDTWRVKGQDILRDGKEALASVAAKLG